MTGRLGTSIRALTPAVLAAALFVPTTADEPIRLRAVPPMYVGGDGTGFVRPEGVACRDGTLVLADTGNGRLVRFAIAGDRITPVGPVVLSQVPYPLRVRLDAAGGIFVLDGKTHAIVRLSSSGTFVGVVEPADDELKRAIVPRSFDVDAEGGVWVLDPLGARVLVLDSDGRLQRTVGLPEDLGFPSDLVLDSGGTAYLVDSVGRRVYVARPGDASATVLANDLGERVLFPTSLAVDDRGRLLVLDQKGGSVVIVAPDGSVLARQNGRGWRNGLLNYPSGLCLDGSNGTVFVADRGNNRVQPFLIAE